MSTTSRGPQNFGADVSCLAEPLHTYPGLDNLLLKPIKKVVQNPALGYGPDSALVLDVSNLPGAGYGLFSKIHFVPGDVISLYDGTVVHNSQIERAHQPNASSNTHVCKVKGTEYVILGLRFAIQGRGMGSFANHSYSNNARLAVHKWRVRYFNHLQTLFLTRCMVVEAVNPISPGDEVTVRYCSQTLARLAILK